MNTTLSGELRLIRLERRVDRIERYLSLDPMVVEPQQATDRTTVVGTPPSVAARQAVATPPPLPKPPPVIRKPEPVVQAPPAQPSVKLDQPVPVAPLAYVAKPAPAPATSAPAKESHLEQTIGLKWAGWVGAIVLVIGTILGVKYAYDNGWLAHLPKTVRLGFIAAAGFALLGAGEYVYRKINVISAASLFGAGVATLFVAAYVGYTPYGLYEHPTAFAMMALSTLIGAAVAMRGNLVSIAVLSLIGANVAPILVSQPNAPVVPFLFYLLAIQFVAVTLASWGRGGKWWTLRGLSLASIALWMTGVLAGPHGHDGAVLAFLIAYGAIYHAEVIVSTLRSVAKSVAAPGVAFSLFVTGGLTAALLLFFSDASNTTRASAVVALATFTTALGVILPRIRPSLRPLALAHRAAAATLVGLAVPVAAGGLKLELGWTMLAVAFAVTWATTRSPISRIAAPILWVLAVGHLVGRWTPDVHGEIASAETWFTLFGTPIISHLVTACALAVIGHVVARLVVIGVTSDEKSISRTMLALSVGASLLWCAAAILFLPPLGATTLIALYAWLLIAGEGVAPQLLPAAQALAVLVLATVKWAVIDGLAQRLSPTWSPTQYLPVFNPLMGTGALVAGSLIAVYWLRRKALHHALKPGVEFTAGAFSLFAGAALVIALMTIGLSFEVDRVVERAIFAGRHLAWPLWQTKQLAWTMLWSASVAGFALAARALVDDRERRGGWVRIAWVFTALLVVKYFILDTFWFRIHGLGDLRPLPLANMQMLAGCALIACMVVVRMLAVGAAQASEVTKQTGVLRELRGTIGMLVLVMIAWMGTFEIDRAVARGTFAWLLPAVTSGAIEGHVRQLLWTCWWCACAAGGFVLGCRRDRTASAKETWVTMLPNVIVLVAGKYLLVDALAWRFAHHSTPWAVLANPEALAAAVVVASLAMLRLIEWPELAKPQAADVWKLAGAMVVAVLLLAGSLEVDRAFSLPSVRSTLADAALAEQVALSIFWSAFAVASVALGFRVRVARLRYFGLTLLAITLLKVVTIDLGQVATGYRILSFLGLGLLLLGTSVLYGKVSPKLLREPATADNT